ncbi:hypothetical protein GN958_ATG07176 [Phytophthora infestans]|uniref:Uncharacterized protein n=1 Tax=Phytophthora infestans TaxID=4787 RepID=A0A8S9URT2_PHYIN|nr:hypothetical protein GN958_ATG15451 [Phytophthora infestans]KAF4143656.1 hypothetical protein GN958_ATG07176 [Phytophthora infestans]
MDNTKDMTADWDVDLEDELDTSMTDASGDGATSEGEASVHIYLCQKQRPPVVDACMATSQSKILLH